MIGKTKVIREYLTKPTVKQWQSMKDLFEAQERRQKDPLTRNCECPEEL